MTLSPDSPMCVSRSPRGQADGGGRTQRTLRRSWVVVLCALVACVGAPVPSAAGPQAAVPWAATLGATVPMAAKKVPGLRVATYNILCSTCGGPSWASRRAAVAATIRSQKPDVVGIQEASQPPLAGQKVNQWRDLRNAVGDPYQMANANGYNCVRITTPYKCVYEYHGASQGTRILYNAATVELIAQGSHRLTSAADAGAKYVAWARFKQLSTGKKFLFVNTHLEHRKTATKYFELRKQQAREVVAAMRKHRYGLPVIMVGDWNSDKWTRPSNVTSDVIVGAGLIDPLGHVWRSKAIAASAIVEKRIRTNYFSVNHLRRQAERYEQ